MSYPSRPTILNIPDGTMTDMPGMVQELNTRAPIYGEVGHPLGNRKFTDPDCCINRIATIDESKVALRIDNLALDDSGKITGTVTPCGPHADIAEKILSQNPREIGYRGFRTGNRFTPVCWDLINSAGYDFVK